MVEKTRQRESAPEKRDSIAERLFSRLFSARELKSLDQGVGRKQITLQTLRAARLDLDDRAKTVAAFKALRLWGVRVNGYQKRKKLYGEFFPDQKGYRGQDRQNRQLISVLAEKLGVREKIETAGAAAYFYELGKCEGADFRLKDGFSLSKIEGSVDRTWHYESWNSPRWYRDKIAAARLMKTVYDAGGFDGKTRALIAEIYAPLSFLAGQNPVGFKRGAILRAFKNRQKYPREKVYGTRGVYNLILGWQRILDAFGNTNEVNTAWVNLGKAFGESEDWTKSLTIKIGAKVNNRLLRHVRVHVEKAGAAEGGDDEDNDGEEKPDSADASKKKEENKATTMPAATTAKSNKPLPQGEEVLTPQKFKNLPASAPVVSGNLIKFWEEKTASLSGKVADLIADAQKALKGLNAKADQTAQRSLQSLITMLQDTRRYLAPTPTNSTQASSQPTSRKAQPSSTPTTKPAKSEIPLTADPLDQFETAFSGLENWLQTMKTTLNSGAGQIKKQLPALLAQAKQLATMVKDSFDKKKKIPTSLPITTSRPASPSSRPTKPMPIVVELKMPSKVKDLPASAPVVSGNLIRFWEEKTAYLNGKVADLIADAQKALNDFKVGTDQAAKHSLQNLITMLAETRRYLAPTPTNSTQASTSRSTANAATTQPSADTKPTTMPAKPESRLTTKTSSPESRLTSREARPSSAPTTTPAKSAISPTGHAFEQFETAFSGLENWLQTMKTTLNSGAGQIKKQLPALLAQAKKLATMVRENFENEKVRTQVLLQIVAKAPVQQDDEDQFLLPLGDLYGVFVLEKDDNVWKLVLKKGPYLPVEIPAAVFEAAGEKLRAAAKKSLNIETPELTVPREYLPKTPTPAKPRPERSTQAEEKTAAEWFAEKAKQTIQALTDSYLREKFNKSPREAKWYHKSGGIVLEKKGAKTWSVLAYTQLGAGGGQSGVRENFTDLAGALKAIDSITKIFEANKKRLLDLKSDNSISDQKPPFYVPGGINWHKGKGKYFVLQSGSILDLDMFGVIRDFPLPKEGAEKQKWLRLVNAYALRQTETVMLKNKIEKILGEHKDSVKIMGLEGRPVRKIILQSAGKKLTLWNTLAPNPQRQWRVVETGTAVHTMEGAINYATVYGLISAAFNDQVGSLKDYDELTLVQKGILTKANALSGTIDSLVNLASVLADYNRVIAQNKRK